MSLNVMRFQIGKSGVTTTFNGPVNLAGTVTTSTATTFTTNAIFQGNIKLVIERIDRT